MSYVQMSKHQCPICGEIHESGDILLNTRLKDIPSDMVSELSLCPAHQRLADEDYIGMVVVSNTESKVHLTPETAIRTGELVHLKRYQLEMVLQHPVREPFIYIDKSLYNKILEWSQTECTH